MIYCEDKYGLRAQNMVCHQNGIGNAFQEPASVACVLYNIHTSPQQLRRAVKICQWKILAFPAIQLRDQRQCN